MLGTLLALPFVNVLAQANNASYTSDMPSVERVKAEIKGSDPTDTLRWATRRRGVGLRCHTSYPPLEDPLRQVASSSTGGRTNAPVIPAVTLWPRFVAICLLSCRDMRRC